jgi:ATP-dependent Clp protease ATP-binding subunit ClpC
MLISIESKRYSKDKKISDHAKSVLKEAFRIASDLEHYNIDCEHILMALLSDKSFGSYKTILRVGVDPEQIKQQLWGIFKDLKEMDEMIKHQAEPPKPPQIEPVPEISQDDILSEAISSPFLSKPRTPPIKKKAIEYFSTDLVAKARAGKIDPTWGREKEIERCIQILLRRTKNNPVFIGEPGVGKTAIAEGIATRIASGKVPERLLGKKIYQIDLGLIVAGTMYRGQFEERLKKIIDEVKADKRIILFIDELHSIVGTGSAEGSLDAANILKPALAKGEIRLIGATTVDEYRKYLEKDSALERRLQPILVLEPTVEETIEILKNLRKSYEKYHKIKITDESINAAANLSKKYITSRYLPDKAIDLMDEASSAKMIKSLKPKQSKKQAELGQKLADLTFEKENLIASEDFERAAKIRDRELKIKNEIEKIYSGEQNKAKPKLTESDITDLVSAITGIPSGDLSREDSKRFLSLEKELSKYIAGQNKAISDISKALRRNRSGIGRENKPIGSFIFLGPSGVGKTELARVLAKKIFLSEKALIKIDMSEFMEKHNVSRLVGAPPGYVGFENAGKLTEAIKMRPYSVVLFDEIEKAHPDVFNLLLQIMDEGKLTDSRGKEIDFTNTVIIMTSNIGMDSYRKISKFGFKMEDAENNDKLEAVIEKDLFEYFKSEFINRIDKVVIFNPLTKEDLSKIARIQLQYLKERLEKLKIKLEYQETIANKLIEGINDKKLGARPLIKKITDLVEDEISDEIIKKPKTKTIKVSNKNGTIRIKGN